MEFQTERRKKSDKAKDTLAWNGHASQKHIRITQALQEKRNNITNLNNKQKTELKRLKI